MYRCGSRHAGVPPKSFTFPIFICSLLSARCVVSNSFIRFFIVSAFAWRARSINMMYRARKHNENDERYDPNEQNILMAHWALHTHSLAFSALSFSCRFCLLLRRRRLCVARNGGRGRKKSLRWLHCIYHSIITSAAKYFAASSSWPPIKRICAMRIEITIGGMWGGFDGDGSGKSAVAQIARVLPLSSCMFLDRFCAYTYLCALSFHYFMFIIVWSVAKGKQTLSYWWQRHCRRLRNCFIILIFRKKEESRLLYFTSKLITVQLF